MAKVLRNRMLVVMLVGLAVVGQSALWEYARVVPGWRGNRFVITPWSVRGYEVTQGLLVIAAAVVLAILAVLVTAGIVKATVPHTLALAAGVAGFAVVASILTEAREVTLGGPGVMGLAALGASVITGIYKRSPAQRLPGRIRRPLRALLWTVVLVVLVIAVVEPLYGGVARPTWVVLLTLYALLGAILTLREPIELGPQRIVLVAAASLLVTAVTMATSVRLTLQRLQFELHEIGAERGEIQVTSGMFLLGFGCFVALVGALGLWAKRRDTIAARERARRQEAAARESERELASLAG